MGRTLPGQLAAACFAVMALCTGAVLHATDASVALPAKLAGRNVEPLGDACADVIDELPGPLQAPDLRNVTLRMKDLSGRPARLVDGSFEGDHLSVRLLKAATADLNGDGLTDGVVAVLVDYLDRGADDSFAVDPYIRRRLRYRVEDDRLTGIPPAISPSSPAAGPGPKVPVSALADALVYRGAAIRETDFTVWGAGPVVDDEGAVHLFAARWPEANVDPAWRKSSELAHYVGDAPEGPFRFVDVVAKGSGRTGEWDAFAPHNPEIKRFGDTYALVYIANSDFRQPPHPLNQSIGMMTAASPYGPWTKVGKNGQILDDRKGHFTEGRQVVNPALVQVGERFFLYYKTTMKQGDAWRTVFGLAISEQLEGLYVHQPGPVTAEGVVIEDASVFTWDEKVCLLTTDNHGMVTGMTGALALWVSDDGVNFREDWTQLGMRRFPDYLPEYDPGQVKRVYGGRPKPERPKVLMVDGKPACLYVASGWIYDGSPRCVNHVFEIDLPEEASPLPTAGSGKLRGSGL